MSNINKQALRNTANRDWFESWFKSEFHPDKTGPYIKDQLFFAVQAARKPLLDELEAAEKSNVFLKGQLAELANFNPDWDKLEASYESWREIAAELLVAKDRIAELEQRLNLKPCPKCNGTGMADSGGTQPWGETIEIECDCRQQDANTAELVAAGIITNVGE